MLLTYASIVFGNLTVNLLDEVFSSPPVKSLTIYRFVLLNVINSQWQFVQHLFLKVWFLLKRTESFFFRSQALSFTLKTSSDAV